MGKSVCNWFLVASFAPTTMTLSTHFILHVSAYAHSFLMRNYVQSFFSLLLAFEWKMMYQLSDMTMLSHMLNIERNNIAALAMAAMNCNVSAYNTRASATDSKHIFNTVFVSFWFLLALPSDVIAWMCNGYVLCVMSFLYVFVLGERQPRIGFSGVCDSFTPASNIICMRIPTAIRNNMLEHSEACYSNILLICKKNGHGNKSKKCLQRWKHRDTNTNCFCWTNVECTSCISGYGANEWTITTGLALENAEA